MEIRCGIGWVLVGEPGWLRAADVSDYVAEIERLRRRVEALEHLVVEECYEHDIVDIPNAMLAQTARDAVARRKAEESSHEQAANEPDRIAP